MPPAADHQRALARTAATGGDTDLLLGGQGRADQHPHQLLGQILGYPQLNGRLARSQDDRPLPLVVPRRIAGFTLHAGHFAADALALGNQGQKLAVQVVQTTPQFVESHIC
ncbi:MAG: hypothetical protein WDM77_09485 [Steroidobacteraceae bacterium]